MRFGVKTWGAVLVWASVVLCGAGAENATAQEAFIYNFGVGGPYDARGPVSGLLRDSQGNLFGSTSGGGPINSGTIFEVSPVPGGGWTEKVIAADASLILCSTLIADDRGNLYGTTAYAGSHNMSGMVFEVSPTPNGSWTYKVLYNFGTSPNDGTRPQGRLVIDAQGNLYGTTFQTSTDSLQRIRGGGIVYELSPTADGGWTEKVLHTFDETSTNDETSTDGLYPIAGLTIDSAGNLYGTTSGGGYSQYPQDLSGSGTVFELVRQSDGSWTEKILHKFNPATKDGLQPDSTLILDGKGNLYGTTTFGGSYSGGTVFRLSPASGGDWTETHFSFNGNLDGYYPQDGLTMDAQGNLFGTTDGPGGGTVFKLIPQSDETWTETTLIRFPYPSKTDGFSPTPGVVFDPRGNLYGATEFGGTYQYGTIFELGPDAMEAPTGTATTVMVSPDTNLVSGEPITLTAKVVPVGGTGTPSGTVTFTEPTFGRSATVTLDETGTAVLKGVVPFPGSYSIYAHYNGVTRFPESTSPTITRTVYPASMK